ncbi:MAG: short-chain dehydrogenase, partial [Armatimonadetes bacterium CSP1-3]
MKQLLDKVAYVTGAAGGIGRALALAFAAEGARIAVVDQKAEAVNAVAEQIKAAGGVALPLVVDVTDATGVPDSIARVHAALGAVDIL